MRFFDIKNRSDCTFQFFIGGRRIGKTYSALRWLNDIVREGEYQLPYLYMRLTESEMSECADKEGELNPYKALNKDFGTFIRFEKIAKSTYQVREYETGDKECTEYSRLAVAKSLISFSNLRGADFSDIHSIVFDEFIPSEKVRKTPEIKKAGWLFANAYETINSNRELFGEEPVRVYFLANAFSLDSSILQQFGLVKIIQNMLKKEQFRYTDRDRSIYVELCRAPEIATLKKETALYKAMRSEKFDNFALENKFQDESLFLVLYNVELERYKPVIAYENVVIYIAKDGTHYYAKEGASTAPYVLSVKERPLFIKLFYTRYKCALLDNMMRFDSVSTKLFLDDALNKQGIL